MSILIIFIILIKYLFNIEYIIIWYEVNQVVD